MTELLPCPFCGADVAMTQRGQNELTIKCDGCKVARTQKVLRQPIDWLRGKMTEHWNTRSGVAQRAPIKSEAELVKTEIARAQEQDAAISASEVEFMDELRRRRARRAPNYEGRHPDDMVLHPLTEIREWDEALAELGIQDSTQTPAEAVRELNAEIERLRAPVPSGLLKRSRMFVELASDIGDVDDIAAAKILLVDIDAALTSTPAEPAQCVMEPDVRWAVNVLLEKIAEKFEGWDTFDLFRSEAAATVRGFKHDLADSAVTSTDDCPKGLDAKGAHAAAEFIADYADMNLTMWEACSEDDPAKARELFDAAMRLRDLLAPAVSSTDNSGAK